MKTIDDFFSKYHIDEFYEYQNKWSKSPIKPFGRDIHKKLSFGTIPGYRNYDLFYERYKSAVELLINNGDLKEGMKILDVGAGEGFFKFFFDQHFKDKLKWYGIEVWKERVEFCRHIGYEIKEINLEKEKIPYSDKYFDIVLASHVIEHLPNPKQIVKDMGRVLKKNGILLVATPVKPPGIAQLDSFYHNISNRKTGDTQQAFTHNNLEKMILDSLNLPKKAVIDKRGFRIISGRKKLPFENWKWFYNLSRYLGKKLLFIVPEINIIVRKL